MTVWGGELKGAPQGVNGANNGVFVEEIETSITINNASYSDIFSFALDVRGREKLLYLFNNAGTITDGVFRILGTQKQYTDIEDLVQADFTETVVAEDIDFGATISALVDLTTPIANALLTGVLVQFRKVTGDWGLTGHLRVK